LKIDEPRLLVRVVGHLPLLDEARATVGKCSARRKEEPGG